jgi:hypothetical protein
MIEYYRKRIIQLFRKLNTLKAKPKKLELSYLIQEEIIYSIRTIEYKVRKVKTNRIKLNNILKNDRLSKIQSSEIKRQISHCENVVDSYQSILSLLRDIGDGIAFIYLDKWDIKPLCLAKERAGFITGKEGFRLELACFRVLKQRNAVGIFNDITNSIRYGDITLCYNKIPVTIEVKSGGMSKRSQRQFEQATNVLNYLQDDEAIGIYPNMIDKKLTRSSHLFIEKNHRIKLNNLLKTAFTSGNNQLLKIEDGLYYHIAFSDDVENILDRLPKQAHWCVHFINDEKRRKIGYFPFTLSIKNPEYLFEFYRGNVLIAAYIDFNVIIKELEKKELILTFLEDEIYFFSIRHSRLELGSITVSRHFFSRLGAEFLSLKWMLNEITGKFLNAV